MNSATSEFDCLPKTLLLDLNIKSKSCPVTKFNGRGILTVQR